MATTTLIESGFAVARVPTTFKAGFERVPANINFNQDCFFLGYLQFELEVVGLTQ